MRPAGASMTFGARLVQRGLAPRLRYLPEPLPKGFPKPGMNQAPPPSALPPV
jgi:hypothetical protein